MGCIGMSEVWVCVDLEGHALSHSVVQHMLMCVSFSTAAYMSMRRHTSRCRGAGHQPLTWPSLPGWTRATAVMHVSQFVMHINQDHASPHYLSP